MNGHTEIIKYGSGINDEGCWNAEKINHKAIMERVLQYGSSWTGRLKNRRSSHTLLKDQGGFEDETLCLKLFS
jgi:hypothetical protein